MAYDVFISYSRKDMAVADKLCSALEKAGVSYWIDRGIHGSANFLTEITRYIRNCKVVVFVASSHSASSPWTQKEILFALKHNKEIVPYRIGDFRFEDNDELDFFFMNVQWIESEQAVVTALRELGCENKERKDKEEALGKMREELLVLKETERHAREALKNAEGERAAKEKAIAMLEAELYPAKQEEGKPAKSHISTAINTIVEKIDASIKTYQVGDYYEENGIGGVVFEVSADGRHGKVLSLEQGSATWCTDEQYKKGVIVGASSEEDGVSNISQIERCGLGNYPAAQWCKNKGDKWYLPSTNELIVAYANREKINLTLSKYKGEPLNGLYWSSTEDTYRYHNGSDAYRVNMYSGVFGQYKKTYVNFVRAIATF